MSYSRMGPVIASTRRFYEPDVVILLIRHSDIPALDDFNLAHDR